MLEYIIIMLECHENIEKYKLASTFYMSVGTGITVNDIEHFNYI